MRTARSLPSLASAAVFAVTLLGSVSLVSAGGCGTTGPYVWVDQLPGAGESGGDLTIKDGDVVAIKVFNQEPLSTREKVRVDGKIVLPVVGEIMVRGEKPAVLAKKIEDKLKAVIVAPSVSVSVEGNAAFKVSVVGEVRQSGTFDLEPGANVLHALASAGGLNDYADSDRVFVVRKGLAQRVRFRFNDLRSGESKSIAFLLRPGDVVIVE